MIRSANLAALVALSLAAIGCQATMPAAASAPASAVAAPATMASPGCARIQRGVQGDIADTRIAQRWPDASYGDQQVAFAGQAGEGGKRFMLMGFDLRMIPKNAVISRAVLTVQKTGGLGGDLLVHRVNARWDERTASYNALAAAWDSGIEPSLQTGGEGCHGPMTVDLTGMVRSWVSGELDNNGVLLSSDAGLAVATSEAEDLDERPHLDVCFMLPDA